MEKPDLNSKEAKKIKLLTQLARSRIESGVRDEEGKNPSESREQILSVALTEVIQRLKDQVPDLGTGLEGILSTFTKESISNEEDFIKRASEALADLFSAHYSMEEIEELGRRTARYKNTLVNRLVEYHDAGDVLYIHVPLTFIENPREIKTLFLDALQKIAKMLQEERFKDIEKVRGESKLVAKVQRTLRDLGFDIISIDEHGEGVAEITKEKLIQLYS